MPALAMKKIPPQSLEVMAREKLALLAEKQRLRTIQTTEPEDDLYVQHNGKLLINFSGNDYFNLSRHPDVIQAAQGALERYGTSSGSSRLITGNHPLYNKLEALLAEMKGTESACVFGSGYLANIGVIPTLVGKGDLILMDKYCHACMMDGAKLSGATTKRYSHNSLNKLNNLLINNKNDYNNILILTETIFSMDGDTVPLSELRQLADDYDAWLLTDDAHGLGIIKSNPAHIQMGTLSKAAGSYGGYVCASKTVIDYIKTTARSLIYTTALPPSVIAAAIAALHLIKDSHDLSQKPLYYARLFCQQAGLPEPESAIVPIILGDEARTLNVVEQLQKQNFMISAIRPPTVPLGKSRLRVTFSAGHNEQDVIKCAQAIKRIINESGTLK